MIVKILQALKDFLWKKPKELPKYDPQDAILINRLLVLINRERVASGLMPFEQLHELDMVAIEAAKFNYKYHEVTNKTDGLTLDFRILKQEYSPASCAELVNKDAKTEQECFFSWMVRSESAGVIKNGFFCHIGIGKCGNIWTAVFARPRFI